MIGRPHIALRAHAAQLAGDEDGSTLVEFSMVISLFLLIFFGLIDFGRLAYHVVTSERAMHLAAWIATVRPPACPGVPETMLRDAAAPADIDYGTGCSAGGAICQSPGTVTCLGNAANPTAAEIWARVETTLPPGATIQNLRFTYAYDARLSFLGGPYVPVVTTELEDVTFQFVTPLGALARVAGATPGGPEIGADVVLPSNSVSLPAEDLAQGEAG
ncbi:MAG: TadE/TadG family type IV pilus assembly protein [Paracoccaceae bacterium]